MNLGRLVRKPLLPNPTGCRQKANRNMAPRSSETQGQRCYVALLAWRLLRWLSRERGFEPRP